VQRPDNALAGDNRIANEALFGRILGVGAAMVDFIVLGALAVTAAWVAMYFLTVLIEAYLDR
jgi:hypothetical protein